MRRIALGAVVVIVLAAAGSLAGVLLSSSGGGRHGDPTRHVTSRLPTCARPVTIGGLGLPTAVGKWPASAVAHGAYEQLGAAAGGRLLALQVCGTDESSVRAVEIDPSSSSGIASPSIEKAAPLASAIASAAGYVWLGTSELDLKGPSSDPPYELTLRQLSSSTLRTIRTIHLGRGYGLGLTAAGGLLVVSTGRQLLGVSPGHAPTVIASFPGVVAQHVATMPGATSVLVSLFTPTAAPPASSTTVEEIGLAASHPTARLALPAGDEVSSISTDSGTVALAVIGQDGTSTIERLSVTTDRPMALARIGGGMPASLAPPSLSMAGSSVFATNGATMGCLDPETGRVRASTRPSGSDEAVSAVVSSGRDFYALSADGIVKLVPPAACGY